MKANCLKRNEKACCFLVKLGVVIIRRKKEVTIKIRTIKPGEEVKSFVLYGISVSHRMSKKESLVKDASTKAPRDPSRPLSRGVLFGARPLGGGSGRGTKKAVKKKKRGKVPDFTLKCESQHAR